MTSIELLRFRKKVVDGILFGLLILSGASFAFFCLYPVGHQIAFWLKHDIWLEKDLITYLRYLDISPYTNMKGLNRIIEWFVSIHIFPFGLIPTFLFLWALGSFAELSDRLESIIIGRSESEIEEDLLSIPTFGLDKIYPVFKWISNLPIWSVLDRVWSYLFGAIFWGFLFFIVFLLYYVNVINP